MGNKGSKERKYDLTSSGEKAKRSTWKRKRTRRKDLPTHQDQHTQVYQRDLPQCIVTPKEERHAEVLHEESTNDQTHQVTVEVNTEEPHGHVYNYIPSNYVTPESNLKDENWYFSKSTRSDAEKLLLKTDIQNGTFMVRASTTESDGFTLSLRVDQEVKHYHIRRRSDRSFYISDRCSFPSLKELIAHYKEFADGLDTSLTVVCPGRRPSIDEEKWNIDRQKLKTGKLLGNGNFGVVYSGFLNDTTRVAIKSIIPGKMRVEDFVKEAQVMMSINHPNLLRLLGVCTTEEPIFIVTEFMQHGNLLDYLRNEDRRVEFVEMVNIIIQIAEGMAYLEKEDYIHRDLAARNVLVGENNIIKVADFGLARLIKDEYYKAREGAQFPLKWTAPEAVLYNRFTVKSDVWSFGVTMHEVLTKGARPYPGIGNNKLMDMIQSGHRMSKPQDCPDALYETMQDCWKMEAKDRPRFEELVAAIKSMNN